jgi:hypothetical protein
MTLRNAHLISAHLRTAVDRLDGLTLGATAPAAVESAEVGHLNGHAVLESESSAL